MTKEQDKILYEVGKMLQVSLPNFYGNIKFNLRPPRKDVLISCEESKILKDKNSDKSQYDYIKENRNESAIAVRRR